MENTSAKVTTEKAPEALWTPQDVADHFKVSRPQVMKWIESDGLPCKKLSDRIYRFEPAAVLEWANAREFNPKAEQQ
jgi:Helix-turn-helix domain